MFRIVRAGCGFRVVLNRKDRQRAVTHAFDAVVVEIQVSDFDFGRQAFGCDCEAVIVRSDVYFTAVSFLDWLIPAAMSKDEFKG